MGSRPKFSVKKIGRSPLSTATVSRPFQDSSHNRPLGSVSKLYSLEEYRNQYHERWQRSLGL